MMLVVTGHLQNQACFILLARSYLTSLRLSFLIYKKEDDKLGEAILNSGKKMDFGVSEANSPKSFFICKMGTVVSVLRIKQDKMHAKTCSCHYTVNAK